MCNKILCPSFLCQKIFQMRLFATMLLAVSYVAGAYPQESNEEASGGIKPFEGLHYGVELQSSASKGKTPLWLNANRYGLSSLDRFNGYLRADVYRPLQTDSVRKWGLGYALDVAVPYNFTSNFVVQQAYVEGRWLHGVLSVGSKEYPMELKNNALSSGSQTLGINARPVPQVRLALPEYWKVPLTRGWLSLKGHVAYGMMTDDSWQHDFTAKKSKYSDHVLYHSKAGYLKIGKESSCPFSIELGLEMISTFGGTSYAPNGKGGMNVIKGETNLKAFWNAFVPGGAEPVETTYKNVEGNQMGSWLVRLNWDADKWRLRVYADKYFDDHSAMFLLDYDGYGKGDEWQEKKDNRYFLYDMKDIMLGAELNLKRKGWLNNVVFEYLYTKYQSGPIYHDHTPNVADHIGGNDDYYNHYIYTGWQHWGQAIGNPLYRSPIYNTDGKIQFENNRFMAFHLGFDGTPFRNFDYRVLATWQDGLGTYSNPYIDKRYNTSFLVEGRYAFTGKKLRGWSIKGGYGMDFGQLLGNNCGFQLTISKIGIL